MSCSVEFIMTAYVEFAVTSNFSFLRGASHPEELIVQADHLGLGGLGLADRNSVAGVVRAHLVKRENEFKLRYHPGSRLVFADGTPDILVYPRDRAAWGRLTRLLTVGNRRAKKGECTLYLDDLLAHVDGLELVVMGNPAPEQTAGLHSLLARLAEAAPQRVRLAASMLYRGSDRARLVALSEIARKARVPLTAVNDVLYHHPDRRMLQDVLTAIREHVTVDDAGRLLAVNAERHLKPPREMARLFQDAPEAIAETRRLSDALTFSLEQLRYEYPDETREGFATPQDALVHLAFAGAAERYPGGIPEKVRAGLEYELALIASLKYAPYFLTVHDIVRFARSKNILCQGRGSAANSAVCFCLGITEVDPERTDLLFERFVSTDRREPPDIDVDFEHERREEVIQYIYQRYGRERAGIAATVISYRTRSAIREVGKAFGLSEDTIGALATGIWGSGTDGPSPKDLARVGLDRDSPRVRRMMSLIDEIMSFPRHLSQHVGGFVITRGRLDEVVPVANAAMDERTFVEWDKDDLDALGILKVDVLGLGMLTCLRKSLALVEKHYGERLTLSSIPPDDPAIYRMLSRADSIGVFQVESRAQMSMLPRLKPSCFYDLVIEVAIVRPGPIQGDMVHPYLRRRQGTEKISYPSPELEAVLHKTLGVPLFQEQAMKIAIVAAGFTPSEADKLRRAMATFKRVGTIGTFQRKMIEGMTAKGYPREFAERCFHQIEGFGEYGFPESHAASFALLVYASAFIKCRYPDAFAGGLLNAQPMGFYAPAQIVRDAREHGVEVRGVDVNHSEVEATLEPGPPAAERLSALHAEMKSDVRATHAVRLGLKEVKGLPRQAAKLIAERRGRGYDSLRDVWLRTGLSPRVLERLADADAFGSLGLKRRDALWGAKALGRAGDQDDLPLFRCQMSEVRGRITNKQRDHLTSDIRHLTSDIRHPTSEPDVALPPMPLGEEVVNDYRHLQLTLRKHPAAFLRPDLDRRGIIVNEALRRRASGERVTVSGLIIIRQRPGTAKGVLFMTLEDETAVANVIVWPKTFERCRPVVLGARYVAVTGPMQAESGVIHVVAERIDDLTPLLGRLADEGTTIEGLARCDEVKRPGREEREKQGRHAPLVGLLSEMPELFADLDVPAHGSHHTVPKVRGAAG
jgi:error-prone DNA polymerase